MRPKLIKRLLLFALPVLLVVCNSKRIRVSEEDQQYIEAFAREWHLPLSQDTIHASFASEIDFITAAQKAVITTVKHKEIAHEHFGDVAFYHKERKGLCYDRAVLLEKFFSYFGFSFRHVYLYFGEDGETPSYFKLLKRDMASHALVEIKTQKGWMVMGTNADWVGVTTNHELLNTGSLKMALKHSEPKLLNDITTGSCFWKNKGESFNYIYGLYSRHGDFFSNSSNALMSLFSFIPDYNFSMLFYNF